MVVRVSEVVPGEPEALAQIMRRAGREQSAFVLVVCIDDGPGTLDDSGVLSKIIDDARRHVTRPRLMGDHLSVGDLRMDRERHEVVRAGRLIRLSPIEYALLEFFMVHHDRALTEATLTSSVLRGSDGGRLNRLWVHIHRLRRKIDQPPATPLIHTIRGVGYILRSPPSTAASSVL
jgi:DNA-binding response OmpR family regulator